MLRSIGVLSLLAALAVVLGARLTQGTWATFTAQAEVGANAFTTAGSFSTKTPTPTITPTPTDTPPPTDTPTPAPTSCPSGDTGFLNASAQAVDPLGTDGFELDPTNAYADDTAYATNSNGDDVHRYFNYDVSIAGGCVVAGIEVRLDWWLDSDSGTNDLTIDLSWDSGTSWTATKTDATETTTEHTAVLGGSNDTWGRSWTASELSNDNFRVRIAANEDVSRSFFLDWMPVKVYYGP